ncbi:hypothetical protein DTO271G3_6305 [Paecilomyces variotii]|nr:hypothetical protein DTO271G3_6305 [Paecilomyces variotii]
MSDRGLLRKDQLEVSLHNEKKLIKEGALKDDNPLDLSESFRVLCDACRTGDLKVCQEKISEGVNINARDQFDYTPLILASLCGHYEVAQLLLDSGALCERDTFQGERCLYNALNDRIRNLLLEYDYSKSTDPLQPFAAHVSSLLTREHPQTSDIVVMADDESLFLHKFILAARSPYFKRKLSVAPSTSTWKLPNKIPPQAFAAAIKYLYLGEPPRELRSGPGTGFTESEVFAGIDKVAKHLEIQGLVDSIVDSGNRRLARQRRSAEVAKGRDQLATWFRENIIANKIVVDTGKVNEVKWDRDNAIFADVLLRADETTPDAEEDGLAASQEDSGESSIPVNPGASSAAPNEPVRKQRSVLFPAHRAMLLRSEFFLTMFSSPFREAQVTEHLNIIDIDCSPEVLEIILTFLYTEKADFGLDVAVEVLFAADLLFIEKLKAKAAVVISSLGSGNLSQAEAAKTREAGEEEIDIYDIIRAAWLTRVQRLEEFGARYLAYRLEAHIDSPDFAELIQESANRIQKRQETDSIELLDDIRFYLSERFRLRFDDAGLEEMMEEETEKEIENANAVSEGIKDITDGVDQLGVEAKLAAQAEQQKHTHSHEHVPVIRTLDGQIAGDEFDSDAINYQILLDKLDKLLERLGLDA